MQNGASTAAQVADFQPTMSELRGRHPHMVSRSAASDGYERRMLADEDDDASIGSRHSVVREPTLKSEAVLEIDGPEQVDMDGPLGAQGFFG
jgi:hypothetical protein